MALDKKAQEAARVAVANGWIGLPDYARQICFRERRRAARPKTPKGSTMLFDKKAHDAAMLAAAAGYAKWKADPAAGRRRNAGIFALRNTGATYQECSEYFGVSVARARQICFDARRRAARPKRTLAADAARFRWMLSGYGYFMEEEGLCGHPVTLAWERERARGRIDDAME